MELLSDGRHGAGPAAGGVVAGRFRLVEELGSGTFAEVWRAVDEGLGVASDRVVVLKMFRPVQRPDGASWPEFRSEVAAALHVRDRSRSLLATAALRITRGDGRAAPALVLPDVGGLNLAHWLLSEPPPRPETVADRFRVLGDVLAALAGVHDSGAAHRDVGFGNIIVGAADGLRAWLTDFGACQIGDSSSEEVDAEAPGLRPLQPPPYGRGLPVGAEMGRDLYAFATVATMTLTGRHPLTDRWTELQDGVWRGATDPHRTLPRRPLRTLAPWLIADPRLHRLETLLGHCLNSDPSARPRSAAAVLAAWPTSTGSR